MGDFTVRYTNFSGGDWGITADDKAWNYRRGHILYNEFSATNMAVYPSGLLGVRAGWKKLDTTGKATGLPATYSGSIRGFDVMGNKLMLATVDKTYDIYWDLTLAPGGTLPANAPIPLPGGLAALAQTQFLRGADSTMKEFLLTGGKLYYRTGDPTGAWTLTGPTGVNLSVVTRWNLYLVAVDKDRPWIIWFSQVDDSGPNFTTWPAGNFLFVGTTEPITTLLAIFNQLYAGRASGWWGISGVLGIAASVRELALGNGPLDQRASSVTTDNRIAYWPLQQVPAFWNGGGVQLVPTQRMDPRTTWFDTTPVMARTAPGRGYTGHPERILMQNHSSGLGFDYVDTPTLLREVGTPPWTTSPARPSDPLSPYGADQRPTIAGAPPATGPATSYGSRWSFNAAGQIIGVRYQRNNLAPASMAIQAWKDSTGAKVAEVVDNQGFVNGAFNVYFPTPVPVAAAETFTVGFYCTVNSPIRNDGVLESVTNTANVTFVDRRVNNAGGNAYPANATTDMTYAEPIFEAFDPTFKGSFSVTHSNPNGTPCSFPPGWSPFQLSNILYNQAPSAWVATDGTNTAWRTPIAFASPMLVGAYGYATATIPVGTVLALFVNNVEVARTNVTKPTTFWEVRTETSFAANDVLSLRLYNPNPTDPIVLTDAIQPGNNQHRPYLYVTVRRAEAAAEQMVCPTTGHYDIHVETMGGYLCIGYQLLVNHKPIQSCTVTYNAVSTVDDFTINTMDANNVALTAGDTVGVGFLGSDYNQGWANRADGPEGTAQPYLRITNRAKQQQIGTLGIPGDQVVVTPTYRRLMFLGDDGATSKIWQYVSAGTWTHDEVPVLIGGMAPSDVRNAYLLPERVVFATQRDYTAESFPKIWTVMHDLDRPALMSDQWASPYDQAMPAGDVLVKGEVRMAAWYDSQGRQVRVRTVEVHFRKWDQGIVGGTNKITARVDSHSAYDRGTTTGTEATWEEPMSGASPSGTEDSWRFNVGDQGFGNGFQVVFTGLYGVALREVDVTVDIRTERA